MYRLYLMSEGEPEERPQQKKRQPTSEFAGESSISHEYPCHGYPTHVTTVPMDDVNSLMNEDLTNVDWHHDTSNHFSFPEEVDYAETAGLHNQDVTFPEFERGISKANTFNVDVSTINKGDAETEVASDVEQSEAFVSMCTSEHTMYDRAEFVSASVIRPNRKMNLGLNIREVNGHIEIASIDRNGLLKDSPLRIGDKLLSIDFQSCVDMKLVKAVQLLKKSMGMITLIARNVSGSPQLVESMITKPTPEFGTGIFFTSGKHKQLQVHDVPNNGLFAQSLVSKGDLILSINDVSCSEIDALTATDIVKSSPKAVIVLAQTTSDCDTMVQSRIAPTKKKTFRRR